MNEIKDVTYGFWGEELKDWQAIQRLVLAGFHDPRVLQNMYAIIEGESGSYTKAWHANLVRNEDGSIPLDAEGRMTVKSIDLGFIQRNIDFSPDLKVGCSQAAMKPVVDSMFNQYPELAKADSSAEVAYDLWSTRGFAPWYAYQPGTDKFRQKKLIAAKAIGNYLIRTQVGKTDIYGVPSSDYVRLVYDQE